MTAIIPDEYLRAEILEKHAMQWPAEEIAEALRVPLGRVQREIPSPDRRTCRTSRSATGNQVADQREPGSNPDIKDSSDQRKRREIPDIRDLPRAPTAVSVTLADVEAVPVMWLWPGRLPAGKLVTLDGDPSLGKSTLALTMAAHVSKGRTWPDGASCPLGHVVVLSAEDGMADTVRPRLDAAGGEPARVHALTAVEVMDAEGKVSTRPPTLADVDVIRQMITSVSARLLIIDVLMAYMPGKVDAHRDQDVRTVLHRLAAVADATGCTILLLRHLNKSAGGNVLYRGGGSIGIIGAARAGLVVAPDPDAEKGDERRVLACTKSNLARMPPSLAYRLVSAPGSHVACVEWCGESEHGAADLLSAATDGDDRREIDRWLEGLLDTGAGAVAAKDVYRVGRGEGYSPDQIKRAKKRLGIAAVKSGMDGGWTWTSEGSTKSAKSAGTGKPPPSPPSVLPSENKQATEPVLFTTSAAPCCLELGCDCPATTQHT